MLIVMMLEAIRSNFKMGTSRAMVQSRTIEVTVYRVATGVQSRVAEELAGYPRGWPLVLSTIRYFVLLAAREKLENDFLCSVQSSFAVVF